MVESAEYTVEKEVGNIEIRIYTRMIIATVYGYSDNEAFGFLFDYIAGNNRSKSKIAMTTPVISSEKIPMTAPVISDRRSFSFVLPSSYTLDTIPEPLDKRVKIEEASERRLAVIRFRGYTRASDQRTRTSELLAFIGRSNLQTRGEAFLMRYNPPFTPGFLRRNEIGIELSSLG